MKLVEKPGSLVAAGMLTLQLVLVAQAQQIVPTSDGTVMTNVPMERSPKARNRIEGIDRAGMGTIQPGKADDTV